MDEDLKSLMKFMQARDTAFRKASIEYGRVEFTCPICGGKAVASKYKYNDCYGDRIGGAGGCNKCGMRYMY